MYDTDLKRFYSVDPLHQFATPYCYVGNNPVSFTDPTGMFTMLVLVEIWDPELGDWIWVWEERTYLINDSIGGGSGIISSPYDWGVGGVYDDDNSLREIKINL